MDPLPDRQPASRTPVAQQAPEELLRHEGRHKLLLLSTRGSQQLSARHPGRVFPRPSHLESEDTTSEVQDHKKPNSLLWRACKNQGRRRLPSSEQASRGVQKGHSLSRIFPDTKACSSMGSRSHRHEPAWNHAYPRERPGLAHREFGRECPVLIPAWNLHLHHRYAEQHNRGQEGTSPIRLDSLPHEECHLRLPTQESRDALQHQSV